MRKWPKIQHNVVDVPLEATLRQSRIGQLTQQTVLADAVRFQHLRASECRYDDARSIPIILIVYPLQTKILCVYGTFLKDSVTWHALQAIGQIISRTVAKSHQIRFLAGKITRG